MDEKISVIIPVYKVEKYLDRCIESVVNQTYQNLEIVLVDDGSPDRCPEICDEWATKDHRIKVIHKENGGLSDARNVGMKAATGEYIAFVDSDDWIHLEMMQILEYFMKEYDTDIVECRAFSTSKEVEQKKTDIMCIKAKEFDRKTSMVALLHENPLKQTVWNKLYKRKVVNDVDFAIGKYHEDEFWTYQVFDKTDKTLFLDIPLYYYFQREDSIMGQAFSSKRIDAIEGRYCRYRYLKENYPELEKEAKENLLFLIMYYGQQALKSSRYDMEHYFSTVEKYFKNIEITKEDEKSYPYTHRIWLKGSEKNLSLICKIRNIIKIGVK